MQLFSFSSVWVAIPVPSFHCLLLLQRLSAFEWLSLSFPRQQSMVHQYPVVLWHPPEQQLLPTVTLLPSHAFCFSFCWTFASGSSPPALSLSVKCCGSRRPVTMQSSSHPASYLLWLLERGGFLMGSLKGWHLTWEEIRGHTELLSGLLNCLGYSTEGKKAKGKQKAITLTLLRHNTLEQTERFGKVQTYERVQGLIAAT